MARAVWLGIGRFHDRHQIGHFPNPIRHASGHRGGHPQRLMDADEVVIREVEADRVGVVVQLFEKPFVSRVKRRMCIRIVRL